MAAMTGQVIHQNPLTDPLRTAVYSELVVLFTIS